MRTRDSSAVETRSIGSRKENEVRSTPPSIKQRSEWGGCWIWSNTRLRLPSPTDNENEPTDTAHFSNGQTIHPIAQFTNLSAIFAPSLKASRPPPVDTAFKIHPDPPSAPCSQPSAPLARWGSHPSAWRPSSILPLPPINPPMLSQRGLLCFFCHHFFIFLLLFREGMGVLFVFNGIFGFIFGKRLASI